jgi:hypothetical protein
MFFIIQSDNTTADLTIYRTKKQARIALRLCELGVTELLLDKYLQRTYKINFRDACLKILDDMIFLKNMQNEIIAKVPDKELNQIARIITYGTGLIPGSTILRKVLTLS